KSFAQEPQESAKFHARSEDVFQQTLRANRQRALYVPFISWIPLLAQGAVLLVGARMVTSGELSVGGFVAFNLYLGMLVTPLRSLGMWIGQAQRATASGERIFQVMDEPEEIAELEDAVELPAGGGDLRFEHVRFEYLEGRPVLDDVTLDLPAGRTIALIGQTGSGKTTLTSLVPRFYDATAGRVLVDGSTEGRIRVGLREAMRGRTTLIIAYRLSTIALADEIVVLDEGRIAARGEHAELLESSEVYRDIYEHGLLERRFADAVEARA